MPGRTDDTLILSVIVLSENESTKTGLHGAYCSMYYMRLSALLRLFAGRLRPLAKSPLRFPSLIFLDVQYTNQIAAGFDKVWHFPVFAILPLLPFLARTCQKLAHTRC